MTQYVGLDVSLKETELHLLDEKRANGFCATERAGIAVVAANSET
jgi:hypothetical protein